jgi:ketosteroid isomerase-like protein
MRWPIAVLLGMSLLVTSCGTSNMDTERQSLLRRDREWFGAMGSWEKFLTYYSPEASVYPPDRPIATGLANIRALADAFGALPGFSIAWRPIKADVSAAGDLGYTAGTYRMTVNDAAGVPVTVNGKYVANWKKVDGEWKVIEYIFNSNAPAPR